MTKKDLQKNMERNTIAKCEIDDAISFITELLEFQATKQKETIHMQHEL